VCHHARFSLPSANPAQYTGRENDGTGLYYYRGRYYSPTLQRFASQDPLGFPRPSPPTSSIRSACS
jgi:RHS repeat-associated protein